MPRIEWKKENMRYMLCALPLVGAAIGLALTLWVWVCLRLKIGQTLFAAGIALIPLLLSGGSMGAGSIINAARALLPYLEQNANCDLNILCGSNEALFAQQFYLVVDDGGSDEPSGDLPKPGDEFVIYNQNAQAVLAAENDSKSIEKAAATVADGKATPANGAVVFTVEKNGEYLRFKSEAYGYLCSNGTGRNAFYSKDFTEEGVTTDDADWLVRTCSGGVGGYELESRTAKYSGHSQWLEYFSDVFQTYSMYSSTGDLDYTIYSFFFYPVADGVNVDGGLVVQPTITFPETMLPAYVGSDYEFELEIDTI